jgi:putative membrane protein
MSSSRNISPISLRRYQCISLFVLAVIHGVGLWGLNHLGFRAQFEMISVFNMLLSFFLVIIFNRVFDSDFLIFCFLSFIIGMVAEIVGVNTGWIFGHYYYTPLFGIQVMKVPVIIGVNWVLLSYVSAVIVARYLVSIFARIMLAASLMVSLDILLEHFAIRHHFWVWQTSTPPIGNYISWFLIALLIQIVYVKLVPMGTNKSAKYYFIILFLFLLSDYVLSYYSYTGTF